MPALRRHLELALLIAGLLVLATAAYGSGVFRATAPRTGSLADTSSGYTITNVAYTLGAGDPRYIAKVTFALLTAGGLAPGATVQVKLIRSSDTYAMCANIPAGSATWECSLDGVTAAAADELAVRVGPALAAGYRLWLPVIGLPRE